MKFQIMYHLSGLSIQCDIVVSDNGGTFIQGLSMRRKGTLYIAYRYGVW